MLTRREARKPKAHASEGDLADEPNDGVLDSMFLGLTRHFGSESRRYQVAIGLLSENALGPADFYFEGERALVEFVFGGFVLV